MSFVKSLALTLFGASWKTTLIGVGGAAAVEAAAFFQAQSQVGWHILAFVLVALGRAAKDANVTNAPAPVAAAPVPPLAPGP
jgi:hypothetical protein